MKNRLENFTKDEDTGVFVIGENLYIDIEYSDGSETENRIYEIVQSSQDLSIFSKELRDQITDWASEYHLSPVRHNLLRHVEFEESDNILELGCGCGAITRQLGETKANVIAIEGTMSRARIAASRCRDLPNVGVFHSNFQNVNFERRFNCVTLIGVLEYAPMFFTGKDPLLSCLKLAKSALIPGGKLLVAIENRLGLKYFNGLLEDHVGKPFFSIQDLYNSNTAKTLGKKELYDVIRKSGFEYVEFQYPFPDYKLPQLLLKDQALRNETFTYDEIIRHVKSRDYPTTRKTLFSEFLVWPVIRANNLISEFANSFLVIASDLQMDDHSDTLAIFYAADRKSNFNTKTEFIEQEDQIVVNKSNLKKEKNDHPKIIQVLGQEKYYPGQTLESKILEDIHRKDFEGLLNDIGIWLNYVIKYGINERNESDVYSSILHPEFIDCLPSNLIIQNDQIEHIDTEWRYHSHFTIRTVFMKLWINVLNAHREHISSNLSNPRDVFRTFAALVGIDFDKTAIIENYRICSEVSSLVYGKPINRNQKTKMKEEFFFYTWENRSKRIIRNGFIFLKRIVNKVTCF